MSEHSLPHNKEAEQAVLGAILLDPNTSSTVVERMSPSDFYQESHQVIFEAMFTLFEKGEPIDIVTVTTRLDQAGKLEVASGVSYIMDVAGSVSTAENIVDDSKIVKEKAVLRRSL